MTLRRLCAALHSLWTSSGRGVPMLLPEPATIMPSQILAQMVCAEILAAPEFNWERDPDPSRPKAKDEDTVFQREMRMHGIATDYERRCNRARNTHRFKTKRIELVRLTPYYESHSHVYFGDEAKKPSIDWTATKPFGKDFNAAERASIIAAIAKAEALQAQRNEMRKNYEAQQRAADALAGWMGVEA